MRWPWSKPESNRGSLTILDDCWVLGVPPGTSSELQHHLWKVFDVEWPDLPHVVVFPFPIDVIDKRTLWLQPEAQIR